MERMRWINWDDVLAPMNRPMLEQCLAERENAYALLDAVSRTDFSAYWRDEARFLKLLALLACHARWIEGELHVAIRPHTQIRFCAIVLIRADGAFKEVCKRLIFPASFLEFQLQVDSNPALIESFLVRPESTEQKLLLAATRAPVVSRRQNVPTRCSIARASMPAPILVLDGEELHRSLHPPIHAKPAIRDADGNTADIDDGW